MTDELSITIGSDVQPGTYPATLVELEPFEIEVEGEQRPLYRWTFALEDGEQTVEGISSRSQSPRGKAAAWIAALTANSDVLGKSFRKTDLVGREALISIEADANGYPKVASVVAAPKAKGKSA